MASLLERMNIAPSDNASAPAGPVRRAKSQRSSAPYNRSRPPKGDVDAQWSHDLYESHNSLSARLSGHTEAPKPSINNLAQRALREATTAAGSRDQGFSIKGAGNTQGNVVEVTGLVAGTTADDVAAIFKRCGVIVSSKLVQGGDDVKVRVTFKAATSASSAVQKFNNQAADGKVLNVRVVGSTAAGTSFSSRLGGPDGLGLVRDEGSVDVLMSEGDSGSKMRSDSILKEDPRAQVMVAPPGTNPEEYSQGPSGRGWRRGGRGGRGRGGRRGGGGGRGGNRMDLD